MDIGLLRTVEMLKRVRRQGWVDSGIDDAESVADHTCAVALFVLLSSFSERCGPLDRARALAMALVHDLAETEVGDITPADNVPREEKLKMEEEAFRAIISGLQPGTRTELMSLWQELHEGRTPEARLVLDADVFERTVQAKMYKDEGHDVDRFMGAATGLAGSVFEAPLKELLRPDNR